MLIKNELMNIKSNLAQSLKAITNCLCTAKKIPSMSVSSYTFESILSIPQNKRTDSNKKRGFCNYLAEAKSATVWPYGGITWWGSPQLGSLPRKLELEFPVGNQ